MVEEIKNNWDFPVELKELKVNSASNGKIVRTHNAVVDAETQEVLGVVRKNYNLIQTRDINNAIIESNSGLQLTDAHLVRNRGLIVMDYKLDEQHDVEIKGIEPNDRINFGIRIYNPFDYRFGSQRGSAFANRLVCTNGMTIPKAVGRFNLKDLAGFDSAAIRNAVVGRLKPITDTAKVWNKWAQTTPTVDKVNQFIGDNVHSKKVREALSSEYVKGKDKSVWGLYNLITYYITHQATTRNIDMLTVKQEYLHATIGNLYDVEHWN